jgi:hypothetical protein
MMYRITQSGAIGLALLSALATSVILAGTADPPAVKNQDYEGKVVPLAKPLEKFGARLDADAAPHWLALVTDDGKVYPLIKDDASRMFFKDQRLLDRPMRLSGRVLPNTHLLQLIQVHSIQKGAVHEVYYWCEVCSIRRNEPDICECCGGPMELREPRVAK